MIDVHAHTVLPGVMGCAGEYGPELGIGDDGRPRFRVGNYVLHGVDYRGTPFMDPDVRLRVNDHLGIDLQMLSPNPITYFHHIEAPVAAEFCRWHNDELAAVVAGHPDRFRGAAQLPMQDVDAAVVELRRAVGDLGLVAAYIGTDFGTDFDDERLDPFWAAAVELDVPVFIHPAPWGIDGPLRDARIRKYDLDLSVGFMFDETIAMACLIYGGVLDRHPGLDICMSHGGGACAYMLGRLEHQGRTRPWARERPVDFQAAMQRMWFDNHVHDDDSLYLLERKVGRDRLVVGTNLAGWDAPTESDQIPFVQAYDDNARRLLRLDR
ncbi:MAG: amidohydrolase family protein [Ilumatobacteraceae bacterium]